ncbi:hypothetical protein Bca52824_028886 [Brassica carinata]|uniref:Uncharacterized protein n=1 Tax=Brassica carinata TaxID=52824 RepID=A0A8X7VCZ2_BRACI|nr:hypothetical protein Bca52824_028886 [Brassica carinata]
MQNHQRLVLNSSLQLASGIKPKAIPSSSNGVCSLDNVCKPMKAEMASKEDDEDTRSTTTSTSTPRGRRSSVGPASGFSFRLEEKAGKRKEVALCLQPFFVLYFLREEEKIHAKEVEKTTMHEKSKIPTTRPISPTLGRRKSSGDATGSETGLRVTKLKDSSSSFICLEETHNKASVKGKAKERRKEVKKVEAEKRGEEEKAVNAEIMTSEVALRG